MSKLTLVGAGPGDPELLTIKALKALKQADYILYDSLVNPRIFDLLDSRPEMIFVGKRRGESYKQAEINQQILSLLQKGFNIVRLKGGDPFVFARAAEELDVAIEHGYQVDIVPGLTSGLSVPVNIGYSLTLRHKADSVMMVTGHELSDEKLKLWNTYLDSGSTLIIYMGLGKISEITESIRESFDEEMRIVAIENGSTENERLIDSQLKNICQDLIDQSFKSPVIFLIGQNISKFPLDKRKSLHAITQKSLNKTKKI